MSSEDSWLLQLANSSTDPEALRAQLAAATLRRPDALQEIEKTVTGARNTGAIDVATATRILTQVHDYAATQPLTGPSPAIVTPGELWNLPLDATGKEPTLGVDVLSQQAQRTQVTGQKAAGISLVAGTVLKDRFVLKREIGRGGMGAVFAAEDQRKVEANDPEPMVAVKVLSPDFAKHPVAFVALQRESRRAQTLAHPNVATVYDFDRDGDVVFMTMELLSGQPLDHVVRESGGKGLERAKALPIIIDIARGLAYAHRKGLVHADLKPGNIFLADGNIPKILDFGIARAVPGHTVAKKDKFDAGMLGAYTPAYATSEMIEGADPHTADDVYALGIIAYELLTGRHPYQRLPAPQAEKRGLQPAPIKGLPRRQWSVIERSLSFNRAQRPADASVFLRDMFGMTRVQKALIAVAVVLTCVAGYFAYANYQEAGPVIPFSQLPPDKQVEFRKYMDEGNAEWNFYLQGNEFAWYPALERYADAWDVHARNRDTAKALRELANRVLADHPDRAAVSAAAMRDRSVYLRDYAPVSKLAPPEEAAPE
jgi:predicted Ser/Thr protein kinase